MKQTEPLPNPEDIEVDEEILIAAEQGELVFFVGNGISRLYGLPSWESLVPPQFNFFRFCT